MGGKSDKCQLNSREALPGGQAEDGLSWSQSSAEGSLALLDGPAFTSPLCSVISEETLCAEMQYLCKCRRACGEHGDWGRQSWVLFCRRANLYFRDYQQSTTLSASQFIAPCNSGSSQLSHGSWGLLFLRREGSGTPDSSHCCPLLASGHSWWLPVHLPLSVLVVSG